MLRVQDGRCVEGGMRNEGGGTKGGGEGRGDIGFKRDGENMAEERSR